MSSSLKTICLITSTHLSKNPRLVKEADALAEAGFAVRVVALNAEVAREELDANLLRTRKWTADFVDCQRHGKGGPTWLYAVARQKLFLRCGLLRRGREEFAYSRFYPELARRAARQRADLYIAHSLEALPAAVAAATQLKTLAGVDFEDSFTGMRRFDTAPSLQDELVATVEMRFAPRCVYFTAASPGVATAVAQRHGLRPPTVVANAFPLAERPTDKDFTPGSGPLRLYWFSQTVGADRGLRDAIRALALLPQGKVELHLRGDCGGTGREYLQCLMTEAGVASRLVKILPPESPEKMISLASAYDVGLALEEPNSENRLICMRDICTNKVYTYLLAGLALAATTEGEPRVIYDGAGIAYPHGQPDKLAAALKNWLDDPAVLRAAKEKAWQLGATTHNWETEKEKLVAAVRAVLNV